MNLSKHIADMTRWPATPTAERLERALLLHLRADGNGTPTPAAADAPQDTTTLHDQQIIAQILSESRWQERAKELFLAGIRNDRSIIGRMEMTAAVARLGETESTIGIGLMTTKVPEAIWRQGTAIGFGRMPRNPEWTGFCNQLQNIRGLDAIINESRRRNGRVGFVLMLPERTLELGMAEPKERIPVPEAELITRILRYHGATEIYWNPDHPTRLQRITPKGNAG